MENVSTSPIDNTALVKDAHSDENVTFTLNSLRE